MTKRSLTLILPLCIAFAVACTSDSGLAPEQAVPAKRLLTTLEVTPSRTELEPGGSELLKITARDQDGARLPDDFGGGWADKATFVSSAPEIARVTSSGVVTAVAPGIAMITVSLTIGDAKVLSAALIEVDAPNATAVVLTAKPDKGWAPYDISMKVGVAVTWIIPPGVQPGTVWLNVWDSDAEKLEFTNGVATRTFSKPGNYFYGTGGGLMWYEEGGVVRVF
jgi:plastocyanin